MKLKVIGFLIVLLAFTLSLAFLARSETGSFSTLTGYSVSVEPEENNSSLFGSVITAVFLLFVFMYIARFIFDDYSKKTKPKEFRRVIELDAAQFAKA